MEASKVITFHPDILRCAVLDEAGRLLSYAESDKGRAENLPKNESLLINILVRQSWVQALPLELGEVRYTVVVTDKYRLVSLLFDDETLMYALPLSSSSDEVYKVAIKKLNLAKARK